MPTEIKSPNNLKFTAQHSLAKKIIGLAILILLAVIIYTAYSLTSIHDILNKQTPVVTQTPIINPGPTIPDHRIRNRQSTEQLTPTEYESESDYYVAMMKQKDSRESLTELRKNIEND